jgi:type III restriction enzyme
MLGNRGKDESRRLRFVLETIGRTAWPGGKVPDEYAALVEKHNRKVTEGYDSEGVTINPEIPPGRDVRCIISVSMLTEGWDATTVTHVVGLRPFGSQLLCEQVVGRALRRTSYAVNPETGLLVEETAQIFGVPFELIPFKVEGGRPQPPTPPANHVYAEPKKSNVMMPRSRMQLPASHTPRWRHAGARTRPTPPIISIAGKVPSPNDAMVRKPGRAWLVLTASAAKA